MKTANQQQTMATALTAPGLPLLAKPTLASLTSKRSPAGLNNPGITHEQNIQGGNP